MPPLYNTLLYDKWVVDVAGRMYVTDMPIDLILDNWEWRPANRRVAVAWSRDAGHARYNAYWESVRDVKRQSRLRGTLVIFRHNDHVVAEDVFPGFKPAIIRPAIEKQEFAKRCKIL